MAENHTCKSDNRHPNEQSKKKQEEALDQLLFYRALPATFARVVTSIVLAAMKIDTLCPENNAAIETHTEGVPSFLLDYVWSVRFICLVLRVFLIIACLKKRSLVRVIYYFEILVSCVVIEVHTCGEHFFKQHCFIEGVSRLYTFVFCSRQGYFFQVLLSAVSAVPNMIVCHIYGQMPTGWDLFFIYVVIMSFMTIGFYSAYWVTRNLSIWYIKNH